MLIDIESQIDNISPIQDIGIFVSRIVGVVLLGAGIAVFGYMVWGGMDWIMAGSDKDKVEQAKTKITNALIGLAIVAVSWSAYTLIDHFFGIGIIE